MTQPQAGSSRRWQGPGGDVEDAITALAELVREAADRLDATEPAVARKLRIRATNQAVKGVEALLELTR